MDISTFEKLQAKQRKSELTQKDFCKQEGVNPAIFSYWKKKLKSAEPKNPFVEIRKPKMEDPDLLLEKHLPFEYQTISGSRLFIPQNFNESSLKKLLKLVG